MPVANLQVSAPSSKSVDPTKFSLLDLPAEIRNIIYETLFKIETPVKLYMYHKSSCSNCLPTTDTTAFSCIDLLQYGESETQDLVDWLASISTYASTVASMTVEVRPLDIDWAAVDLLPLLKFLWGNGTAMLDVHFSTPGTGVPDTASAQNTELKNYKTVLSLLLSERFLKLQRYLSFPRLMPAVCVYSREAGGGGVARYHPDSGAHHEDFSFNEEEGILKLQDDGAILSPVQRALASWWICDKILKCLIPFEEVVAYNLTEQTVTPSPPSSFAINRELWVRSLGFFDSTSTELSLTTNETTTTFEGKFPLLGNWKYLMIYDRPRPPAFRSDPIRVRMRFVLAEDIPLRDVRIDATPLFKATKSYYGPTELLVELQSTSKTSVSEEPTSMKLVDFQDRFLVALDDFTKAHPIAPHCKCPTIWFDGHLAARDVESELITPCHTVYTSSEISSAATEIRGQAQAKKRRESGDPAAPSYAGYLSFDLLSSPFRVVMTDTTLDQQPLAS